MPEAVELTLLSETSLTVRDLRGERRERVERREPTDLFARLRAFLHERWPSLVDAPQPVERRVVERVDGLSEQQVLRYFTLYDERQQMREEATNDAPTSDEPTPTVDDERSHPATDGGSRW